MDRGAWQATVHGVAKSQTQLSDQHFHYDNYGKLILRVVLCNFERQLSQLPLIPGALYAGWVSEDEPLPSPSEKASSRINLAPGNLMNPCKMVIFWGDSTVPADVWLDRQCDISQTNLGEASPYH